jgi:hypothetical protein
MLSSDYGPSTVIASEAKQSSARRQARREKHFRWRAHARGWIASSLRFSQ